MARRILLLVGTLSVLSGCGDSSNHASPVPEDVSAPAAVDSIGLDLEFTEGEHPPLAVIAGSRYSVDSLSMMSRVVGDANTILDQLVEETAFADLDWTHLSRERMEWLPQPDGSYRLDRFYRGARWMLDRHVFEVTVKDAAGVALSDPIDLVTEITWPIVDEESFATRRIGAMIFVEGVAEEGETEGTDYSAEVWMQFRNGIVGDRTFVIPEDASTLEVVWNQTPTTIYEVPLEPVTTTEWNYGFSIEIEPSPPANGNFYVPSEEIEFRLTFHDGEGKLLHSPGSLPTYGEFLDGTVESGLQYYNFFPAIVYYRDKNREGVLLASLTGPRSRVKQTHRAVPTLEFLVREVQEAASVALDGYTSQWAIVPPSPIVFGAPSTWNTAVSDTVTMTLPGNAPDGLYDFVIKARRVFRGETSLTTSRISIPVGDGPPTPPPAGETGLVGNCETCHEGPFALDGMLHYNADIQTCTACHLPLEFETNNLLPYRIHRIHNLSARYREDRRDCTPCHLNPTIEVEDNARWLVCTGCHDPADAHDYHNYLGDLASCADVHCHHTENPMPHILNR